MKKKLTTLLCFVLLISFEIVAALLPEKSFSMTFLKRGETTWGISKVNKNIVTTEPLDGDIEFSLWDPNSSESPKASFGVYWNIYLGERISLYLDFNSAEDGSGQYMLSSVSNNLNYSAQATLSDKTIKSNSNTVKNDSIANDATLFILENVKREPYTMLSGTALITLTLIPNQENNSSYIMDGTYEGYVFLTLETI